MKVSVYVATTQGPVRIERITREAAPVSQVCLRRTTTVLPISPSYDAFVRQPSGVIERFFGPFDPGGFRLDAASDIGDGESWQLAVFVAHALAAESRLAGPDERPDAALWLTGTVDVDLNVGEIDYLAEKVMAARQTLEDIVGGGVPVTLVVPGPDAAEMNAQDWRVQTRVLPVQHAAEVLRDLELRFPNPLPVGGAPESAELIPLSMETIRMPRWRLIASLVSLLVFVGVGIALVLSLPELEPGSTFRDCGVCPEMVVVPAGTFMMGSTPDELKRDDEEGPPHQASVASVAIGKYEVTRAEFTSFAEETGYDAGLGCFVRSGSSGKLDTTKSWRDPGYPQSDRDPVVCVSWNAAQAYLSWLSQKTGQDYRFPSEAEWEYAARAGTDSPFHFGSTITSDQANYNGTHRYGGGAKGVYRRSTLPVGSFPPNAFGLHDMHGNVWEWVEDCWNGSYRGAPTDGSAWLSGNCGRRVMRGGAWSSQPKNLRSANRSRFVLEYRNYNFGIRVARSLGP